MNHKLFRTLTWLMWLALPLTALRFLGAWDQLPLRMASHFDANWRPNGWMPREVALGFALGVTAFLLVIFTAILLMAEKQRQVDASTWAILGFFYLVIGFVFAINSKVVSYNLGGGSANVGSLVLVLPAAIFALMAVLLRVKRGEALPPSVPIAEEVNASPLFGFLMMVGVVPLLLAALPARPGSFHLFAVLISAILVVSGASAWSGFHYLFSSHGLEIRTLGFRLRSIPVEQLKKYSIQPWSFWRGYGIRGLGSSRAYVWGNSGVQIDTAQGSVFLGHSHPERIMRDLDMITKSQAQGVSRG